MRMQEVVSPADKKEFLQFPLSIYKGMNAWIQPLNQDVESVFDPTKNKTFKHGECARWLLKNGQGTTIGRIAAFVNQKNALKGNDQPTGGIGFFECVEDRDAAFFMLTIVSAGCNSAAWRQWMVLSILVRAIDGGVYW